MGVQEAPPDRDLPFYFRQPSPDAASAIGMLFIQMPYKVREHCSFSDADRANST